MTTAQPIQTIAQAVAAVGERISPVRHEQIDWSDAPGRVLAARTRLDRPSPACDVSAMDGYALSFLQTHNRPLRVHSTSTPGVQAPPMPDDADAVVRIFTGAMVPRGARAIVQRELVIESGQTITLTEKATLREGQNIRHAGENAPADLSFAEPGAIVTPGVLAGLAACGHERLSVYRPLRVAVLVTGDEVLPIDTKPEPWQLRDSNGPHSARCSQASHGSEQSRTPPTRSPQHAPKHCTTTHRTTTPCSSQAVSPRAITTMFPPSSEDWC